MSEDTSEKPFGKLSIKETRLQAMVGVYKDEAHKISEEATVVNRFSFSEKDLQLFELSLARYLINKLGGETARDLRNPITQVMAKIPVANIIPRIMEHSQREDEEVVKRLDEEIKPLRDTEVEIGQYLPGSIVNAANIISSSWIEHKREGKDFQDAIEKRTDYIKDKVLKRQQPK